MAFKDKRQSPKGEKTARNRDAPGNVNGTGPHDTAANPTPPPDEPVIRYVATPPARRDYGREEADERARSRSAKSLLLRQHFDCEPPWDINRARASFENPRSPYKPWPDRADIWPTDMAGYWPCPVCAIQLIPVGKTPMKLFRCITCTTETFIHVKAPVVNCPRHGRHEIELPWHRNDTKWTYLGPEPPED